jgi:hypothetical protein
MMPKDHTPVGVLRAIRDKYPHFGSAHLLRVFSAQVHEDGKLRDACIQHAFAAALRELATQPPEPSGA